MRESLRIEASIHLKLRQACKIRRNGAVILKAYCAGPLYCVRSTAVKVNDMSGGELEDTNQKCAHILIWSLFLLNADRCLENGVEEGVQYLHRLGSE